MIATNLKIRSNSETSSYDRGKEVTSHVTSMTALNAARAATQIDHDLTVRESLKIWKKATIWSLLLSLAIIMEAYDTNLLGNFMAYPSFREKFGTYDAHLKRFNVSAKWQLALNLSGIAGQILGLALNGWICERIGYRRAFRLFMFLMTAVIAIPFFAPSIKFLLLAQVLEGIPWGAIQTLTTSYASEICPLALRPYLTTWVNACWGIGKLLAAGVLRGCLPIKTEWGYRIPYALQWIWPIPLFILSFFLPESPFWLVRKGRNDEARRTIDRITTKVEGVPFDGDNYVAMIVHTNELEKAIAESSSYLQCFKGTDLRRTFIACTIYASQNLCGNVLGAQATFFLSSAGLSSTSAYSFNLGIQAAGVVGVIIGWFLMPHFGRRTIFLSGLLTAEVLLTIIGILGCVFGTKSKGSYGVGALLLIFVFVFDVCMGPMVYAIVAEISSTRHRIKTIALARITYNLVGMINGVITPYQINVASWNWGAKTGFYWAGINGCMFILHYFNLPETKDRTFGELDVLFEKRVRARDFAKTDVDQYAEDNEASKQANTALLKDAEGIVE